MKKLTAVTSAALAAATLAHGATYEVYQASTSVKTSVIREMNVKVKDGDKTKNMKVHYRAPVTKRYTMFLAKSGDWDGNIAKGYGRMWTSDKQKAFTFDRVEESYDVPIGSKGRNQAAGFYIYNSASTGWGGDALPVMEFIGLGASLVPNGPYTGVSGVAYGYNVFPAPCVSCKDTEMYQGGKWEVLPDDSLVWVDEVPWNSRIDGVYYPERSWGWENSTHFYGTCTIRPNASMSKKEVNNFEEMKELVDARVPKAQQ